MVGVLSVPFDAPLGNYSVSVGDEVIDAFEVVEGPFDRSSVVVLNTSPYAVSVSLSDGVDVNSFSVSAVLSLLNSNFSVLLNSSNVSVVNSTYVFSFDVGVLNSSFAPVLNLSVVPSSLSVRSVKVVSFDLPIIGPSAPPGCVGGNGPSPLLFMNGADTFFVNYFDGTLSPGLGFGFGSVTGADYLYGDPLAFILPPGDILAVSSTNLAQWFSLAPFAPIGGFPLVFAPVPPFPGVVAVDLAYDPVAGKVLIAADRIATASSDIYVCNVGAVPPGALGVCNSVSAGAGFFLDPPFNTVTIASIAFDPTVATLFAFGSDGLLYSAVGVPPAYGPIFASTGYAFPLALPVAGLGYNYNFGFGFDPTGSRFFAVNTAGNVVGLNPVGPVTNIILPGVGPGVTSDIFVVGDAVDLDGDNLPAAAEVLGGTSDLIADFDGDTFNDGAEAYFGYNPTNPLCHPPLPPPPAPGLGGGVGGGGGQNEKICVPSECQEDGSVSWKQILVDEYGKTVPNVKTAMNSFDDCFKKSQAQLTRPASGLMVFAVLGKDKVYHVAKLPEVNEERDSKDAAIYYQKQKEWLQKIADSKAVNVDPEPVPICPGPPKEDLGVYLRPECVGDSKTKILLNYGWTHSQSVGDVVSLQRLTYVVDGVETTVDIDCDTSGKACDRKLEIELPLPESTFNSRIFVEDNSGISNSAEAKKPDCKLCPPVELIVRGELKSVPDPCCTGETVPSACCANNRFKQGYPVSSPSGKCYQMSTGGPAENVCLAGQMRCDVLSPGFVFDASQDIYGSLDWVGGDSCSNPVDPFTQSLSEFEKAKSECSQETCKDGERREFGRDVGICKKTIYECQSGVWVLIKQGVRSEQEVCDGKDNNCNGVADDIIMLCSECYKRGDTRMCGDEVQTCIWTKSGLLRWNKECRDVEPAPVLATEVAPGQLAVLDGVLRVPCGDNVFDYCVVSDKKTDGPLYVAKAYGGAIASPLTGAAVLPSDYVKLASYDVDNCDGGTVDIATNIPPVDGLLALYKEGDNEIVLPSALGSQPSLAGYDVQHLFDAAKVPFVSYVNVKEGVILSVVAPKLSALGITADFSGDIDGVRVSLENAAMPKNKALAVVGRPLKMVFDNPKSMSVNISGRLVLEENIDPSSLGFYVLKDKEWVYVGGKLENDFFVVSLDVLPYLSGNSLTFMIAGNVCEGCVKPYLFTVRDVGSPLLVVLVHGLFSDPQQSMSALLKEFDDEDVNVDVAVFGYSGAKFDDAVLALSEELRKKDYSKIVFISHSLGGLVVREFLHQEEQKPDSLIPKVVAFIMAGVPNQGTPLADSAGKVFEMAAWLLGRADNAPIMNTHPGTLSLLSKGLQYPVPSSVKVFSLAGTKDSLKSGVLLGLPSPNDGVVSVESAKRLNGVVLEDACVDELEQPVGHLVMNSGPEQRYTLLYFLRKLSSEFNEKAPPKMYAALKIGNCQKGVLELYGKPVDTRAMPPPEGCEQKSCGNKVCELGEDCPADCVPEMQVAFGACGYAKTALDVLLGLNLLLIIFYNVKTWKFQKVLRPVIYALAISALPMFAAHLLLCGTFAVLSLIVYAIILLMIFVDLFLRTNSDYYRWH
ncbi:Uncharacterised protein [uncultured archaeon]|nr:Uncharacterised protein [uncultured archaeon]